MSGGRRAAEVVLSCVLALSLVGLVATQVFGADLSLSRLAEVLPALGEKDDAPDTATDQTAADSGDASQGGTTPAADAAVDSDRAQDAPAEPVTVSILMAGDVLQHESVYASGLRNDGTYDFTHVFANVADEIQAADLAILNQETPIAGTSFGLSGYPSFNGPQEMGDAEVAAGFDLVLKASNHTMDQGYEGLHSELDFWATDHPEVGVVGAVDALNDDEDESPYTPYVYEKDGFTVAVLNFTYDLNGYTDPAGAVAMLYSDEAMAAVTAAKAEADAVVVCPHWGEEYQLYASQAQWDMAQRLVEAGADVILGDHPHVIEPVVLLASSDDRQVPCYWSVGNFVSGQPYDTQLVGGLAEVSLTKGADGAVSVTSATLRPVVTHKGEVTTYLLEDYTDELASTNVGYYTANTTCTPDWVRELCASVLGPGFDPDTSTFTLDLTGPSQPGVDRTDAELAPSDLDLAA